MNEFLTALITGLATFTATNLDDIVILTLLFAQVNHVFQIWHIVVGQYQENIVLAILALGLSYLWLITIGQVQPKKTEARIEPIP